MIDRTVSVYLAGPLHTMDANEERRWREQLSSELLEESFQQVVCLSPMENSALDDHSGDMDLINDHSIRGREDVVVAKDLQLVDRSDLLFANLEHKWETIGTIFEIGYAYSKGKPIVVLCKPDSYVSHHAFIRRTCIVVNSLEEARDVIISILCG